MGKLGRCLGSAGVAAAEEDRSVCIQPREGDPRSSPRWAAPQDRHLSMRLLRINGRPWKVGSHCFFFKPTDAPLSTDHRAGKVLSFVLVTMARKQHLFLVLDERVVIDTVKSIHSFDVTRPEKRRYIHVDHVTHLVGALPYWFPGRQDIRCGVPIASTMSERRLVQL